MINNEKMITGTALAEMGVKQRAQDISVQMTHKVEELTQLGRSFLETAGQFVQQSIVLGN